MGSGFRGRVRFGFRVRGWVRVRVRIRIRFRVRFGARVGLGVRVRATAEKAPKRSSVPSAALQRTPRSAGDGSENAGSVCDEGPGSGQGTG